MYIIWSVYDMYMFRSVAQSWLTLHNPMDHSKPVLTLHHQLLEFTQTHLHWVGDAIQPTHPLLSPFPPAFNLSQHQGLFKWDSYSHQVAKVLEFPFQHQSFQWIFRTGFVLILEVSWAQLGNSQSGSVLWLQSIGAWGQGHHKGFLTHVSALWTRMTQVARGWNIKGCSGKSQSLSLFKFLICIYLFGWAKS